MNHALLPNHQLILASGSPRRKELLSSLGFEFRVQPTDVDEHYPSHIQGGEIVEYLATIKASAFPELKENEIVLAADTIVCISNEVLNKPANAEEGENMLRKLSGREHKVITGVCLRSLDKETCFHAETTVRFRELTQEEITFYLKAYKPYDKAGGYGIQEWIGLIGIEHIEGSYFNVVGLPVHEVYRALLAF